MGKQRRPRFTAEHQRELWTRWEAGESLSEIARALGRWPGSIRRQLLAHGGYVPAERSRCARALSFAEREDISRGLAAGLSVRRIAARLGRPPSTVSREVGRNGGRARYRAARADERAWRTARRPKASRA